MKECQFCEEKIKDEAVKCQFCGEWLDDKTNEVVEISDRFARENKAREQGGIIGSYKIYFLYKLRYQTFDWNTFNTRPYINTTTCPIFNTQLYFSTYKKITRLW